MFQRIVKYLLVILSFYIFANPASFASHLKGKSKETKDKYFNLRIEKIPSKFNQTLIKPSSNPKELVKDLVENKNTKKIEKIIPKSSLLSVLYFDGSKVIIDKKSKKISNNTKLYSFSISKSFVSYILGDAICKGHIKSLDDKASNYLPDLNNSLYSQSTFKELINMTAGDLNFLKRKDWAETPYASAIIGKKLTVKDVLQNSSQSELSKKKWKYNNLLTDIVARSIDITVPGGLKSLYQDFANKAGTQSQMFYISDKNGWPLLHGWFYATREDFLRLAIHISNEWKKESCIGKYLQNIETMKVNADGNAKYAGYFWFDKKDKPRHAQMRGHGHQRININLEDGSVLLINSIAEDFNINSIFKLLK
jgi:hypothetical protein